MARPLRCPLATGSAPPSSCTPLPSSSTRPSPRSSCSLPWYEADGCLPHMQAQAHHLNAGGRCPAPAVGCPAPAVGLPPLHPASSYAPLPSPFPPRAAPASTAQGYGLFGYNVVLVLAWMQPGGGGAWFYYAWFTVGALSALTLALTLRSRTPDAKQGERSFRHHAARGLLPANSGSRRCPAGVSSPQQVCWWPPSPLRCTSST